LSGNRAPAPGQHLLGAVTDSLDIVSIGIDHEGFVV